MYLHSVYLVATFSQAPWPEVSKYAGGRAVLRLRGVLDGYTHVVMYGRLAVLEHAALCILPSHTAAICLSEIAAGVTTSSGR